MVLAAANLDNKIDNPRMNDITPRYYTLQHNNGKFLLRMIESLEYFDRVKSSGKHCFSNSILVNRPKRKNNI